MNSSLCKLNNKIAEKWFCIVFFWLNNFIFYIFYYVDVKKKNEMSFKFGLEPRHPISEIKTYVWRLKRLETWLTKNQVFLYSREWEHNVIYSGCQVVEWLTWVRRSWNIPKIDPNHSHFMVYIKHISNCIVFIDWGLM